MTDQPVKTCFVTIGATASFSALVRAVLSVPVLVALENHQYTHLIVQYGANGQDIFDQGLQAAQDAQREGTRSRTTKRSIQISGFDLDSSGLGAWLRQAKGHATTKPNRSLDAVEGVVISHAGSGTILDALRMTVPIIVVPNTELLDNHQVELAEALAEQGYVVHGDLDDLASALDGAELLRTRTRKWPPIDSETSGKVTGLKGILDEEMGFLD